MNSKQSTIQIDRLALEGDGVGRIKSESSDSGKVVFSPYTLPNETVLASMVDEKKSYSRWIPEKILKTSQHRGNPSCAHFFQPGQRGLQCGGCDWQHISDEHQLTYKSQLVEETLQRIGGFSQLPMNPPISSPKMWRYRNKVQVPIGIEGGKLIAGFYSPGSHRIIPFKDCPVQPEGSLEIFHEIVQFARGHRWAPYLEDKHRGWLRHILIRANKSGDTMVTLVSATPAFRDRQEFVAHLTNKFPQIKGIHQNVQKSRTHVILGPSWRKVWGEDRILETILEKPFGYSPGSFFQINSEAAEAMFDEAIKLINPQQDELVVDLYSGVGVVCILSSFWCKVAVGVETSSSSIRDALFNAKLNLRENVKFLEGQAEAIYGDQIGPYCDLSKTTVVLDPPRSGCAPLLTKGILKWPPRRIVYISCHPATLARDCKMLSPAFKIKSVTPVDLFPQTSHIETLVLLEKQ